MKRLPVLGYFGRIVAAGGAVLLIVSLFVPAYNFGGDDTYWDLLRRMDYVVLGAGVAVLLLLVGSLYLFRNLMVLGVSLIGAAGIGFFTSDFVELPYDETTGAFLANLASALIVVGGTIALLPALAGRSDDSLEPAFLTAEPPAPAQPTAGWYEDPSGQARLRYWDGGAWTEQTQE